MTSALALCAIGSQVRIDPSAGGSRTTAFRCVTTLLLVLAALALPVSGAQAAPIYYTAILDGPSEAPPNASPGTGFAWVTFDLVAHTMEVSATFSGLVGTTTAAHIHAPTAVAGTGTASVATQTPSFAGFPLGVTAGVYPTTMFDMTLASSYRAGYLAGFLGDTALAEAALAQAAADGKAYFNIHSTTFPGGEIRGFLQPAVPEPASLLLLGTGLAGLGARRWRRRR